MKQPTKTKTTTHVKPKKNKVFKKKKTFVKSRNASDLDGSGLETYFRVNILDKLGVEYDQQFEAHPIGRFYDFYLPKYRVLIECDGDFYHSNPEIYTTNLTITQKRNKRVDELKNKWASLNNYVLIRFWEKDIYGDSNGIIEFINQRLKLQNEVLLLRESKKNGSFFSKKI